MKIIACSLYVVILLMIIFSFLRQPEWRFARAEMEVTQLAIAASAYHRNMGVWPSSTNWFAELTGKNSTSVVYHEARTTKDPWGHDYTVLSDNDSPRVYSPGEDGISNSHGKDIDDINNWSKSRLWQLYYRRFWIAKHLIWTLLATVILLIIYKLKRYPFIIFRFL